MCHHFISMYLKNFRLGYQFMIFRGHLNRVHNKKYPQFERKGIFVSQNVHLRFKTL